MLTTMLTTTLYMCRALLRFPQVDEGTGDFDSCEVVDALIATLNADKSKEVRKAVLAVLPMSGYTLPYVVARTRDESDKVRQVALLLLAEKTSIEMCAACGLRGVEMSQLLSKALLDRVPAVVEAGQALVTAWFDSCGGEPLTLLKALGVDGQQQASASELALHALFACQRLNGVHVAMLASEEGLGLRSDFRVENPNLMTPEEALFWRVVCVHLSSEASEHGIKAAHAKSGGAVASVEAASAGERLEAFEAVMPSCLEDLAYIIGLHRGEGKACAQLLLLAAQCADFADASGRKCVGEVVGQILVGGGDGQGVGDVIGAGVVRDDFASSEELYDACFEVVRKLYSSDEGMHEAAGKAIQAMLVRADLLPMDPHKVHSLTAKDQAAVLRIVAGFLALIKRVDMFDAVVGTGDVARDDDDDSRASFSWQDVFSYVIYPCTTSAEPAVRALSYKCMGLFCLVERDPASCSMILKDMMNQLMTVDEDADVKAKIVQGLGDGCLLRGPQAIERLLAAAGGPVEEDVTEASEAPPSIVDVLVHYAHEWMETDDDQGFRACGEAVVESLVKLVAVNEFRRQADEAYERSTALEDGDMVRIIVNLFMLCFHSCTAESPKTRQSLLVFFQRYATMSVTCQQYLATSFLGTARTAAALDQAMRRRTIASGAIAPQVIKFAVQLLQMHVLDRTGARELFGHEPLAEIVMGEIIACATNPLVSKLYLNTICKVPVALPTYNASDETRGTVARIHAYALHAISLFESEDFANGVCLKEVEGIKKTYKWPTEAGDVPDDEELDRMAVGLLENLEAFCAGFPQPFAAEALTGVTGGNDDSSDEDFDEEGVAAEVIATGQRRLPARRGRTRVDMGELSEDEEDRQIKKLDFDGERDDVEDNDAEDNEGDEDENEDAYAADEENSAINSPMPAPTPKSGSRSRDKRRQSMASVAALGEALSAQARI